MNPYKLQIVTPTATYNDKPATFYDSIVVTDSNILPTQSPQQDTGVFVSMYSSNC